MNSVFSEIYQSAVVPVITLENKEVALRMAEAFLKGKMNNMEIAMRNEAAAACMEAVSKEFPQMAMGAGTVLTLEQLEMAKQAGARFVVSPGFDDEIVNASIKMSMPVIPGTISANDVIKGLKLGLKVIKFFPAEPMGGLETIKFLSAPFKEMKFLPAGGITPDNYVNYLNHPAVFACAGGFMARDKMVQAGDWEGITKICEEIHKNAVARLEKYPL